MIEIGDFQIVCVQTGTFRLDGGGMFGVVPRVMWAGHEEVDEHNRMLLATRTLVAVSRDRKTVLLTDTGAGTKWAAEQAERFGIEHDGDAIERVLAARFELTAMDVTDVIVTHLHFDHNGGLTEWVDQPGGDTRLQYPRATHWLHGRHWDHARNPSIKDRASFHRRDFAVLEDSPRLRIVEGDAPDAPWPGVRFFVSDGHTPGQLLPVFEHGGQSLMFTGDVFPTSSHLRLPWVMAYDLEPLKTIEEKERILARCREDGLRLVFPHDHRLAGAEIDFAAEKPFVARTIDLE